MILVRRENGSCIMLVTKAIGARAVKYYLPGAYSVSETLWTQFSIQAEGCDGALAFNIQAVTLCYCS